MNKILSFKSSVFVFLLFLITACIIFSNTLPNSFFIDDYAYLQKLQVSNLDFLIKNFIPHQSGSLIHDVYYRPLTKDVWMLSILFLQNKASYYFISNSFCLFVFVCVLFLFLLELTKNYRTAFFTSILFLVHPIHEHLAGYITANQFSFVSIFMLLSAMFYLRPYSRLNRGLSILFFVISLLFHEIALSLPFFLMAISYCVSKERFPEISKRVVIYFIIFLCYFLFRMKFVSFQDVIFDKYAQFNMNIFEFVASFSKLVSWYLGNLLYPSDIVLMWTTPVVTNHVWLWLFLLLSLITFLCLLIKRFGQSLETLSIVWLMIGFIPVVFACLFDLSGLTMDPNWLTFGSIGFFLFISLQAQRIYDKNRHVTIFLLVSLVLIWSVLTYRYNALWLDGTAYIERWISKAPPNKALELYLADAYYFKGKYKEAREYYLKSIANGLPPQRIYINLGVMDFNENNLKRAYQYFLLAFQIKPNSIVVLYNLGILAQRMGNLSEAEKFFIRVNELNPSLVEPRLNLARIYWDQGRREDSIRLYYENLKYAPLDSLNRKELIQALSMTNRKVEALELLK